MRYLLFLGLCICIISILSACDVSTGADSYSNSSSTDYRSMAYQDAVDAGIPPDKFVKQIQVESGFNPNAVSSEGAVGIAQFLPSTASGLGINPYNPVDSLKGAANLMGRYQANYGDYSHALAAYNCGTGCLASAMRNCSYFYWCLPSETERYINMIMN